MMQQACRQYCANPGSPLLCALLSCTLFDSVSHEVEQAGTPRLSVHRLQIEEKIVQVWIGQGTRKFSGRSGPLILARLTITQAIIGLWSRHRYLLQQDEAVDLSENNW